MSIIIDDFSVLNFMHLTLVKKCCLPPTYDCLLFYLFQGFSSSTMENTTTGESDPARNEQLIVETLDNVTMETKESDTSKIDPLTQK